MQLGLGDLRNQIKFYQAAAKEGKKLLNNRKQKYFAGTHDTNQSQRVTRGFTLTEAASILGVNRDAIRYRERERLVTYPAPPKDWLADDIFVDGKKRLFSLDDIRTLRGILKKGFFNGDIDRGARELFVLAFMFFKGGVAKTTQSVHLAIRSAMESLRVLFLDLDPQGSGSLLLGKQPLPYRDITFKDVMLDDIGLITQVIEPTHFSNLDIITGNLDTQKIDLDLWAEKIDTIYRHVAGHTARINTVLAQNKDSLPQEEIAEINQIMHELAGISAGASNESPANTGNPLFRLRRALELVKDDYDLVVIDCPPNHHLGVMSAMTAANGLIIPSKPDPLSFSSILKFNESMLDLSVALYDYSNRCKKVRTLFEKADRKILLNLRNDLFRILITDKENTSENRDTINDIETMYKDFYLKNHMLHTQALTKSAGVSGTLYDDTRKAKRHKDQYMRASNAMEAVNNEIMSLLKQAWK